MKYLREVSDNLSIDLWPEVRISLKRIEQIAQENNIDTNKPIYSDEGAWGPMLIWCRTHVKGRWHYYWNGDRTDELIFNFRTKGEATRFKLTWG